MKTTNPTIANNIDFGIKLSSVQKAVFKDMPQDYFKIYVTNANENVDKIP